ncbi:MAG TPA: hypothetical protein PLT37_09840 [Kiritimatiellia bacterium]|nr:hypothetical protein [Kiritimatiellia bacterium]HQG75574.1 hypothetical protein [Kiritimatiellia bacterium]
MTTTTYTFGDYTVTLTLDQESPLGNLRDLHICHLGMRFLAPQPLPEFQQYEFDIAVKQPDGQAPSTVKCCGIVVSSQPEDNAFRTVIHFADLCGQDRSSLHTLTRDNRMRCEDCGNC